MATAQFFKPTDMTNFDWKMWGVSPLPTAFKPSAIHYDNEIIGIDVAYYGSFVYDYFKDASGQEDLLGVAGGTLEGYVYYQNKVIVASIRGMSIDAVAAFHYMELGDSTDKTTAKIYNTELLSLVLAGDDTITGSYFDDVLLGFGGRDIVAGGNRDDRLEGGSGNDTLSGNSGRDRLLGGAGKDQLAGGSGGDQFIFEKRAEGGDTIDDFAPDADSLRFDASAFGNLPLGALSASVFQSGGRADAGSSAIRFIYETDTGILRFDADGKGGADAIVIATLVDTPNLDANDIVII